MSEYEGGYEEPTHDEPTADYPPADQYDSLIGQPIDGGYEQPHEVQSVGGFVANDGYGAEGHENVEYADGAEQGANYGEPAADYAGAEGQYDPNYAGGDQPEGQTGQYDPNYTGGDQPEGDPNYAADGAEYAQPTQGTSTNAQG